MDFRATINTRGVSLTGFVSAMTLVLECVWLAQATASFQLSVLEVSSLELRVQAENKAKYCHAVWIDPVLAVAFEFSGPALGARFKSCWMCFVTGLSRLGVPRLAQRQIQVFL